MESLITNYHSLQDVILKRNLKDIHLPQIVVVGLQSSGKSSVLETIVGKDFLPRGKDMVTRCPLILQLNNLKPQESKPKQAASNSSNALAWAPLINKFSDRKGEIFHDFDKVREEIEAETERRAGSKKKVCSDPITLKIFSSKVTDLTLIDLPGITKVPVDEQPEDIETQIRNLIVEYISNPNSIILAVIAANTDLATSDALQLAKEHDQDGKRTLGVLTKLDLMDKGTDATDVLLGKVIPFELGIIGVVNRSQQDIDENKPIEVALKKEVEFLMKNYPDLESRNGSAYLIKRLSSLLMNHIRDCLPELRNQMTAQLTQYLIRLRSYGETLEPGPKLLDILEKFTTSLKETIKGTLSIQKTELTGGAKICEIFVHKLGKELDEIDALKDLKDDQIRLEIKNATGLESPMNVPQRAFKLLVKDQMKKLEQPCLRCINFVYDELETISQDCASQIEQNICPYPKLNQELLYLSKQLLDQHLPKTKEKIGDLLLAQVSYINVQNEQFSGEYNKLVTAIEQANSQQPAGLTQGGSPSQMLQLLCSGLVDLNLGVSDAAKERAHRETMKLLVQAYFCVVKNEMKDMVPKYIVCFLVDSYIGQLHQELISQLHKPERFEELFFESTDLADKRKSAVENAQDLQNGLDFISKLEKTK